MVMIWKTLGMAEVEEEEEEGWAEGLAARPSGAAGNLGEVESERRWR